MLCEQQLSLQPITVLTTASVFSFKRLRNAIPLLENPVEHRTSNCHDEQPHASTTKGLKRSYVGLVARSNTSHLKNIPKIPSCCLLSCCHASHVFLKASPL